jgi:hypothetical protein
LPEIDPSLAALAPTCRVIPHYRELDAVHLNLTDVPASDPELVEPLAVFKDGDLDGAYRLIR